MNDEDRRLVALAALFARGRASALAARLPVPVAADAVRDALRLAAAPRAERLDALRAAMASPHDPARAAASARLERPAVSRVLRAVAEGVAEAGSPVLVRLCRERLAR